MSNKEKKSPELRFKGFSDAWEQRKLSALMDFSNGINAPKEKYGKGRKMLSVLDILSATQLNYDNIRNSVEVSAEIEKKNKVESGDIVFVRSSEVVKEVGWSKAYTDNRYALFSGFTIRGKRKDFYSPYFVELYLNTKGRKQIEREAGGSTRFNISQEALKKINIKVTGIREQNTIEDFFQTLDEIIYLHQRRLTTLKSLKQQYLSLMFPKNSKKIPQISFKPFKEEWEQHSLGEIAKVRTGKAFKSSEYHENGKYLVITNKNINDQKRDVVSSGDRIDINDDSVLKEYSLVGDNILITMDGVHIGQSGRYSNDKAVLAQRVGRLNSNQIDFVYQITQKKDFIAQMNRLSVGNAIKHISLKNISNYSIMIPPNEDEKKAIGLFLKYMDYIINLHQKKLHSLNKLKNIYLNKMFI